VFSCWNGATVFDADVFAAPDGIRFRMSRVKDFDDNGQLQLYSDRVSECFLSSVDMWKHGRGKIMIVPKARFVAVLHCLHKWRVANELTTVYHMTAIIIIDIEKIILGLQLTNRLLCGKIVHRSASLCKITQTGESQMYASFIPCKNATNFYTKRWAPWDEQ
jgi:hypothetical protein